MLWQPQQLFLYTILYILFIVCIIYPPVEFQRAGFTIQSVCSAFVGVERDDFIGYHLRRTVLTRFIHCCLPFFYFVYLSVAVQEMLFVATPKTILQFGAQASVVTTAVAAFIFLRHCWNKFEQHPTVRCLKRYPSSSGTGGGGGGGGGGDDENSWRTVAKSINAEYRNSLDTLSISLTGIDRVIMTSSWILNVTNYTLTCAQVSDVALEAIRADEHPISIHEQIGGSAQFIDIRVKSITGRFEPFIIRVRAESFRDLRSKLDRPIAMARQVVLKQSLSERFVDAFIEQIAQNPKYDYTEPERLEPCLGCSAEISNIKLWKRCLDNAQDDLDPEGRPRPQCTQCYCRPMWCDTCMGRIFASKQDPHRPDLWMPGKAQCPTCRATFCVLDVAFLNII